MIGATPVASFHTKELAKFTYRQLLTEPNVDRFIACVTKDPKTPFDVVFYCNTLQSSGANLVLQEEPPESKYANQQ